MAERLGNGLQHRLHGFESRSDLKSLSRKWKAFLLIAVQTQFDKRFNKKDNKAVDFVWVDGFLGC